MNMVKLDEIDKGDYALAGGVKCYVIYFANQPHINLIQLLNFRNNDR